MTDSPTFSDLVEQNRFFFFFFGRKNKTDMKLDIWNNSDMSHGYQPLFSVVFFFLGSKPLFYKKQLLSLLPSVPRNRIQSLKWTPRAQNNI